MKAKKAAIKGIIILACVLALCMFFSGTIRTITTAKVKIVTPREGRFTQTVELKGKLAFTQREDVPLPAGADITVEIKSVSVKPGQEVEAGDTLFTGAVSNYEATMTQYRQDYAALEEQLLALERKDIRLRRTEETWAAAYNEYCDASEAGTDARLNLEAELRLAGLTFKEGEGVPDSAPDAVRDAYARYEAAQAVWETEQKEMQAASRYSVSEEIRTYVTEKRKLDKQLQAAKEKMLTLQVVQAQVQAVTAAEDGYIVDVYVKRGDTLTGGAPTYAFCPRKKYPVLRASLEGVTLAVTKGMEVTFKDRRDKELESEVAALGWESDGKKYADVELDRDLLEDMGGAYAASQAEVNLKIEYRARQATTLVPSTAIRGSGKERYVFAISYKDGAFGTRNMVVTKTAVTVLAEAGGITSIGESMGNQPVAYMEDRPIEDGATVMAYVE